MDELELAGLEELIELLELLVAIELVVDDCKLEELLITIVLEVADELAVGVGELPPPLPQP